MAGGKIKSLAVFGFIVTLFISSLSMVSAAAADNRPYFRVYGGDVFVGGGFNSGPASCNPSDSGYQAPQGNNYKGSIFSYVNNPNNQNPAGAGAEFGALATGLVEGASGAGEPYGFGSSAKTRSELTFANDNQGGLPGNFWGGFLEGSTHQTHCLPDYFGTKRTVQSQNTSSPVSVSALGNQQYLFNGGGILKLNGGTIAAGAKPTLFVDGDVFISSSITYASHTAQNIPKFALVVLGNIFVDKSVDTLEGLYVAQPNTSPPTNGIFWTCHPNRAAQYSLSELSNQCRSKLTVNGAVVASKVNLTRTNGNAAAAAAGEAASSANIAEVFNYTPETFMGGGFFSQSNPETNEIQSIISLPPIF